MSSLTKAIISCCLRDTSDFRLGPFETNHDAPLALFVIPHGNPRVFGGKFEAGCGISGLVDYQQRPECRRWVFCNRVQQPQRLFSGPDKTPPSLCFAQALGVEQVRERVFSITTLSVLVAQVRECDLYPLSAQVAFLQSHYLAHRVEALFAGLLRCLGRHLNPGAVSDVRGNLKTYRTASKGAVRITETQIARKAIGQSRCILFHTFTLQRSNSHQETV